MSIDKSTSLEEQYDKIYRYCYFKVKKQELVCGEVGWFSAAIKSIQNIHLTRFLQTT